MTHLMCYTANPLRKVCAKNSPENTFGNCLREEHCGGVSRQTTFCQSQPRHEKLSGIFVNNQFGTLQIDTIKEEELCIPSTKTLQP